MPQRYNVFLKDASFFDRFLEKYLVDSGKLYTFVAEKT